MKVLDNRLKTKIGDNVFTYHKEAMSQDFLSHKFASWLVQRGVYIYEVSKLLGHSDIKTTQIYAHLRNEDLRDAVELLE